MTSEVAPPPAATPPAYPIRLNIARAETQSRITNFPLFVGAIIRMVLLIPHFVVLFFLGLAAAIVQFIATIAILFTGRYPRGMFDFYVGVTRWGENVYGYMFHLHDVYPPFSMDQQPDFPSSMRLTIQRS